MTASIPRSTSSSGLKSVVWHTDQSGQGNVRGKHELFGGNGVGYTDCELSGGILSGRLFSSAT
jgi:hypothetical protein